MTVAQVTRDALNLNANNRAFLAHVLLTTLDEPNDEWLNAWGIELKKRKAAVLSGESQLLDYDEVMDDLRARFA